MSKNVKHVPSKPKISSLQILEVVNVFVRTKLFKALHSYAFSGYCTWLNMLLENSLLIKVSGNCNLTYDMPQRLHGNWQELF